MTKENTETQNTQEEITHLFLPKPVDIKHRMGPSPRPQMRYPHITGRKRESATATFREQDEAHYSALSGRDTS